MNMRKTVFWWNIPCAGMIGVLKAYADQIDSETIVITGQLSKSRKAMGWDDNGKLFKNHIILTDDEWIEKGKSLLDKYPDRLHVFNGITHPPRMQALIEYAIASKILFSNMSEAYFNLESGIRKILKGIFMHTLLPFRVKRIARYSQAAICLSGGSKRDINQLKSFGFKRAYEFGYFTDIAAEEIKAHKSDGLVHILCPGLIEHYKGVDILIKALANVKHSGIKNFKCHITGKGKQQKKVEGLITKLGLTDYVIMEGVLDSKQYQDLLSKIDMLVAPGRVEPWGIRINEAIQRGNVVVVSDGLGANCLIKESNGGAVFESGNPKDLADKMISYLSDAQKLADAKRANIKYMDHISCRSQAKRLYQIISLLQN